MIGKLQRTALGTRLTTGTVIVLVLALATVFGLRSSIFWLILIGVGASVAVVLQRPSWALAALIPAAIVVPLEFSTGTDVSLNPATIMVPGMLGIWALDMLRQGELHLVPSRANRPLVLFLAAGMLSLLVGIATWDPAVPHSGNFAVVQVAQWALFAFSAGAFWLTGNLVHDEVWLQRLTFLFLFLTGSLVIILVLNIVVVPNRQIVELVNHRTTIAFHRAPFWMLLAALSGGQLLFNGELSTGRRLFLLTVLGAVLVYAFHLQRDTAANWVGVAAALGVLAWLRWPRLRWLAILLLAVLAVSGGLFSNVYEFAGGSDEWVESGGSRLALIGRVVEVTMRNPITGLGPAAYRRYVAMEPLAYGRALWLNPQINSHNNYIDLFSQIGLLGLGLFIWFAVELAKLGLRLRAQVATSFAAGFVNAMLAAGAGSLVLMLLADYLLPLVYNIGFPGFQASVLIWLFLGGLISLDTMIRRDTLMEDDRAT